MFKVRVCELFGLHDLNQREEHVRQKIVKYLNRLVDIGFAGFRIDAARHMFSSDLAIIYNRVKNLSVEHGFEPGTRPFIYQEVRTGREESEEYGPLGRVTDFIHARGLCAVFRGLNSYVLADLVDFFPGSEKFQTLPEEISLVFLENQDLERDGYPNINYKEPKLYKMALVLKLVRKLSVPKFLLIYYFKGGTTDHPLTAWGFDHGMALAFMLARGYSVPKIISSYAFAGHDDGPPCDSNGSTLSPFPLGPDGACANGWLCQHRWRPIYNMALFRKVTKGTQLSRWWDNRRNQIAFSIGNIAFIAINADNYTLNEVLQTNMPAGVYCDLITGDLVDGHCGGRTLQVREDGSADVTLSDLDENGVLAILYGYSESGPSDGQRSTN